MTFAHPVKDRRRNYLFILMLLELILAILISEGSSEFSAVIPANVTLFNIPGTGNEEYHFTSKINTDRDALNLTTIGTYNGNYKINFVNLNSTVNSIPYRANKSAIIHGKMGFNNTMLYSPRAVRNNSFIRPNGNFSLYGYNFINNMSLVNSSFNQTKTFQDIHTNTTTLELASDNKSKTNAEKGILEIIAFIDSNQNGIQDPNELEVSNLKFIIINLTTYEEVKTIIVDNEGIAQIKLYPGYYLVCEMIFSNWENTTPLAQLVTISSNEKTILYFGNLRRSTGGGYHQKNASSSLIEPANTSVPPNYMERASSGRILQMIIDDIWNILPDGFVLYNPSSIMQVGKKELVEVRIARDINYVLTRGLKGSGEAKLENISKIGTRMRVELHGDSFKISPLFAAEATEQPILGNYSKWEWEVTPLASGNQTLRLYVDAIIEVPGYKDRYTHIRVFEKTIYVKINELYEVKTFLGSYWQWIVTTLVGSAGGISLILAIYIYLLRRVKKKELEGSRLDLDRATDEKVKKISTELGIKNISASKGPKILKMSDKQKQEFLNSPIEGPIPYLFLDAQIDGRFANKALLIVTGIHEDGCREILSVEIADCEDESCWENCFESLKARGLTGVKSVISDNHKGIQAAVEKEFVGASWKMSNISFDARSAQGYNQER